MFQWSIVEANFITNPLELLNKSKQAKTKTKQLKRKPYGTIGGVSGQGSEVRAGVAAGELCDLVHLHNGEFELIFQYIGCVCKISILSLYSGILIFWVHMMLNNFCIQMYASDASVHHASVCLHSFRFLLIVEIVQHGTSLSLSSLYCCPSSC